MVSVFHRGINSAVSAARRSTVDRTDSFPRRTVFLLGQRVPPPVSHSEQHPTNEECRRSGKKGPLQISHRSTARAYENTLDVPERQNSIIQRLALFPSTLFYGSAIFFPSLSSIVHRGNSAVSTSNVTLSVASSFEARLQAPAGKYQKSTTSTWSSMI